MIVRIPLTSRGHPSTFTDSEAKSGTLGDAIDMVCRDELEKLAGGKLPRDLTLVVSGVAPYDEGEHCVAYQLADTPVWGGANVMLVDHFSGTVLRCYLYPGLRYPLLPFATNTRLYFWVEYEE
jgi:hypothetical protein